MYHNSFLQPANPLIGRLAEVREIRALLSDPGCRLLTLVGPGGIGKTTLVSHVAADMRAVFGGDVAIVPLQAVPTPELIAPAIAAAIGVPLAGTGEPLAQVCHYLHDKTFLLVLDNLEHLLAGLDVLTTLLQLAPASKLLVTSREALNLRDEWLYPVSGLAYPPATAAEASTSLPDRPGASTSLPDRPASTSLPDRPASTSLPDRLGAPVGYAAVQLFVERARRVRPDFALGDEYAAVVRICQLVEGLPLALELAASWTKTLRCERIAAEIEQSLDFLSTRLRDLPTRHHSMKVVFEHSWAQLGESEQAVFTRLCVFRGGFDQLAAAQATGTTLAQLADLVDKSLVRWEAAGRYRIHELLRQYGEEKLAAKPADFAQARDAHARYYTDLVHAREHDMYGGRQLEAAAEIEAELDNIRSAWQWAIESDNVEAILRSSQTLGLLNQFRSRYREGIALYEQAMDKLGSGSPTPSRQRARMLLLGGLGWLYIRLGRLEHAQELLERCRALYGTPDYISLPGDASDPEAPLGLLGLIKGDYDGATRLAESSRQRNAAHGHRRNLQYALYVLAGAARARGEYAEAQRVAQEAYMLTQQSRDRWFMAYCLNELGQGEQALGNYDRAAQYFHTSYGLRQEFADSEGMAVALRHLGQIAMVQAQYAEARERFEQSRALYERINDRGGLAVALEGIGAAALELGEHEMARKHLHAALEIAVALEFVPLIFSLFVQIGAFYIHTGQPSPGLQLLELSTHHAATDRATKDRAQHLLAPFQSRAEPDLYATAMAHDQAEVPAALAASLLIALAHEPSASAPVSVAGVQRLPVDQAGLIEPLSPRELEVLHLLAEGHSNPQIADTLIISVGTVKTHTHTIFAKLGVANRTQAVRRSQALNLV